MTSPPRTVLVVGATGATGKLVVRELLGSGHRVHALVRDPARLPEDLRDHPRITVVRGAILDFDGEELAERVRGCDAVISCLGHTLSFRGIYGPPRRLVTDAVRNLVAAIRATRPASPVRLVLMSTTGYHQEGVDPPISGAQKAVLALLRVLVPPHPDNEGAATYLRTEVGTDDPFVHWVAARPDSLIDAEEVSDYDVVRSPTRSAIFDSGKTSRINVAHFLADLATENGPWGRWKGRMPVIYNREPDGS